MTAAGPCHALRRNPQLGSQTSARIQDSPRGRATWGSKQVGEEVLIRGWEKSACVQAGGAREIVAKEIGKGANNSMSAIDRNSDSRAKRSKTSVSLSCRVFYWILPVSGLLRLTEAARRQLASPWGPSPR